MDIVNGGFVPVNFHGDQEPAPILLLLSGELAPVLPIQASNSSEALFVVGPSFV